MNKTFRILTLSMPLVLLCACNSETNLLGRTTPVEHHGSVEALYTAARAAYDRNDLEEALALARKANQLSPDSERIAILFGFINLSMAGADPYRLAGELAGGKPAGSGASDTLSGLKSVLGLTEGELAALGDREDSDPELPLLVPRCVEPARAAVAKLQHLDDAIRAVCPFTDPEVRVAEDPRQSCELTRLPRKETHRAHFLWAFTHLTEALAFHAVLTYGRADPEGKKSNLELRVDKIRAQDPAAMGGLPNFLASLGALEATLARMMPIDGVCSKDAPTTQLSATLNDMLAVDLAFDRIPGTPDTIKASIKRSMARVRQVRAAGGARSAQTEALKADFTKKVSGNLAAKIDEVAATQAPDEGQREQICDAYASIASGGGTTPALCAEGRGG